MKDWPIFEPQAASRDLADHPHRVQLVNRTLAMPALCPNCGAAAARSLVVRKVFVNADTEDRTIDIESLAVPYCDRCIALHEREVCALSWPQRLAVSLATGLTLPALGAALLALLVLPDALRELTRAGFPWPLALVAALACMSWFCLASAWKRTEHRRVPPQTSVTRAFDFSASHAETFDEPRSTYSVRNAEFFKAFTALNRDLAWDPGSRLARRSKGLRTIVYGGALVMLFVLAAWDIVGDLLPG